MNPPDWLDELPLQPGPPWLTMATRNLELVGWLRGDEDRERDLVRKAVLLEERHGEVFAALDTPEVGAASLEVLELVLQATGQPVVSGDLHPLDAAGRLVQEDLFLMVLRDGAPHLDAASLCFPSYWRLADKLGRPMTEVHGPVAHYSDELAAKVDTFLQRLRPDRPVWRRNWSVHDDPAYFLPDPTPPRHVDPPAGLWLRSELQTLRRLTSADVVLFTIRTQQVPLEVLTERPDVAHQMADAIAAWSPAMRAYKGDHGALEAEPWLRSL